MDRITLRVLADPASFKKCFREGTGAGAYGVLNGLSDDDDTYADDFEMENNGPMVVGERVITAATAKDIVSVNLEPIEVILPTPLYQHTLLSHPINTPYQHTLSTHPIILLYQHTLSTHAFKTVCNTPYQHTISTHPTNTYDNTTSSQPPPPSR